MTYSNKEAQKEATKERVRRYRALQKGVTPPTSEGVTQTEGVTGQGVTSGVGVTRLNPASGLAYGPSMASMPEDVLAEYERKWKQHEPVYGVGQPGENMARTAVSEGFEKVYHSLASKHLENEVRVGVYGPTVKELWDATHPC